MNIPTRTWHRPARRDGTAPPPAQLREIFFVATRDAKSGVIYLKVVNTSGSSKPIQVQLEGAPKLSARGEAVILAGKSLDDTNSIDKPENVVPRSETLTGIGPSFAREFPPYSVTVLKLKSK